MSILGLIPGAVQPVKISRDGIGFAPTVEIDAAISYDRSRSVQATKIPVESGADITDHVHLGNVRFELEGLIAESALSFLTTLASVTGSIVGGGIGTTVGGALASYAGTVAGAALLASAGQLGMKNYALSPNIPPSKAIEPFIKVRLPFDRDYPKKVYDYLLALQQERELVKISSRMGGTLNKLLIVELSAPQTIENGRSVKFKMVCEQIQIVKSAMVPVPENIMAEAVAPTGAAKETAGKKAGEAASGKQEEVTSIGYSLGKSLKGAISGN